MPATSIRKYRLTSAEEPSDRMLAQLMKFVRTEANRRALEAQHAYFEELALLVEKARTDWENRSHAAADEK